jgi:hypothetical protein
MTTLRIAGLIALCAVTAGCADSAAKPEAVQAMAPQQVATLRIAAVNCTAANAIGMTQTDIDRVCRKVKLALDTDVPGITVDPTSAGAANAGVMTLTFTGYDAGDPRPGGLLSGLGNTIQIDADIVLADSGGATLGRYRIAKQFAVGGVNRGAPVMEAVEDGFAKSVAAIFETRRK